MSLRDVKVISATLFTGEVFFPVSGSLKPRSFKEVGLERICAGDCKRFYWDLIPVHTAVLVGSIYTKFYDAIPWFQIEHLAYDVTPVSMLGGLFGLDRANPFHPCVTDSSTAYE